jgi:hypothetical protein
MSRGFKESVALLRAVAVLGVVGAACLTRPVVTADPNLKTNFTSFIHSAAVNKLDLLFMIDNSSSMGDKQQLLAAAIPDMINRLVSPNCVDPTGAVLVASMNGVCTAGAIEFPPVHDMHLGIVSSSLGARGDPTQLGTCDPNAPNTDVTPNLNAHNDDRGELINRGGPTETPVAKAQGSNFLAWFPAVKANAMATAPANAEITAGAVGTGDTLIGDFASMISGVHEHGCGFEAQNESWYRFLVQPDPYDHVAVDGNLQASYQGFDATILAQRANFLRPDSLLAVIVVTDETQETPDPLSVGKLGWLFDQSPWPRSPTSYAPQGTIECNTNPEDANCQSCANSSVSGNASTFATRCPPIDGGQQGYLPAADDGINVRFFHQKQRFGVSAGYPSTRYVTGLTSPKVPDRNHEDDSSGNYVGDQQANLNCVNPIFATNLPTDPTADLCNLTPGPRTPDLVYYALIGGVPHQLLQVDPTNPDSPQKDLLTPADWQKITGTDPEHYDFSGADPHMLESEDPRATNCTPPNAADNCDPINGREWATSKQDLQYACIFTLPMPKDCTQPQFAGACDCEPNSNSGQTPLCQTDATGKYTNIQIKGKAYPDISELVVAHAMADQVSGVQGIVSSLCPIHTTATSPSDPVYGYRPAVNAIINRLKNALSVQCLPQKLTPDMVTGDVPCLILVTLPTQGPETDCDKQNLGLAQPTSDVLTRFQAGPHSAWVTGGGAKQAAPDPSSFPTCVLTELTPQTAPMGDFDSTGSCANSMDPGWCYVEGTAAGICPQQVLFTQGQPPPGATVNLQCIEQANGAIDGG